MKPTEMVKLSAIAMGAEEMGKPDKYGVTARIPGIGMCLWNPLKNDEQAMALVKKFGPLIQQAADKSWWVTIYAHRVNSDDLNRAIVECVSKMEKFKCGSRMVG